MKKNQRLSPIRSARLLLEMAASAEARSDLDVISAEADADGTLTRVVVQHLVNGNKFLLSAMILGGQVGLRFDPLPATTCPRTRKPRILRPLAGNEEADALAC
jgi:hypothetical protein